MKQHQLKRERKISTPPSSLGSVGFNIPAGLSGDAVAAGVYYLLQLYLMESRDVNTLVLSRDLHVGVHRVRRAIHTLRDSGYLEYEYDGVRVRCKLVTPNAQRRLYRRKSANGAIEIDFGRVSHVRLPRVFAQKLIEGVITVDGLRLAILLKLRKDASKWSWSRLMETLGWSRSRLYRAMRGLREAGLLVMDTRGERYLIGTPAYAEAMRVRELRMQSECFQQFRKHMESLQKAKPIAPQAVVPRDESPQSRPRNATEIVLQLVRRGVSPDEAVELTRKYGARALTMTDDEYPPPE
jgi:biotin operon repressor